MTDLEGLFLLVVVFYLLECSTLVRRDELVLSSALGRRFSVKFPSSFAGDASRGLVLRAPLPPLGLALVVKPWPLSISSEGLLGFSAPGLDPAGRPAQSLAEVSWSDAARASADGRAVKAGGAIVARTSSGRSAEEIARLLRRLAEASGGKRKALLREALAESFDIEAIEKTIADLRRRTVGLRMLTNTLWIELFVLLPLAASLPGLAVRWRSLGLMLLVAMVAISLHFYFTHRALWPKESWDRWLHLIEIALFPPATIRAHDVIFRDALDRFHPIAVASVLLPKERFELFARAAIRDLRHPRPPPKELGASARAIEGAHRATILEAVESLLRARGLDPETLAAGPDHPQPSTLAYCPRCHAEYQKTEGECEDCGGISILPLKQPVA
jgi:hypothetical protein